LFARQKVDGAQRMYSKKIDAKFHQHSASNCANKICPICKVKFAKFMRCLPKLFVISQTPFAKLFILFEEKYWQKYIGEIDPGFETGWLTLI